MTFLASHFRSTMRFLLVLSLVVLTHSLSPMPRQKTTTTTKTALKLKPVASVSDSGVVNNSKQTAISSSLTDYKLPTILPKLIVFDLDNTLWTPELYQIRTRSIPKADQDIRLFPGARRVLEYLHSHSADLQLAIASRTNKGQWARQLLHDFTLNDGAPLSQVFSGGIQILTGSKKKHFESLRKATGVKYQEMIFFDDDMRLNLKEISQMNLLCGYCPKGMTVELFKQTMERYNELHSSQSPHMGEIISTPAQAARGQVLEGMVDFYDPTKKFGFVKDGNGESYFFHESKVPQGMVMKKGMPVKFESMEDGQGRNAAVILLSDATSANTMPCFTMSQPFASLLLNCLKTVESRNNDMFVALPEGTRVLLHVGRKDWHDTESWKRIVNNKNDEERALLNKNCKKGQVVGVITVGKTWLSTDRERSSSELQRKVLAPAAGIGKFCTEITSVSWFKKGIPQRGRPGIYEVNIPKELLTE